MSYNKLLLLALPMVLVAQEQPGTTALFRSETRLVVLNATALDKDGKLLMGLPKNVFQVFENGIQQEITTFRQEDVPVSLGLVIDNSASMGGMRDKVAAAALAMVRASNPNDEVFVVNFAETPSLDAEFTNDIEALKRGLNRMRYSGGTAMRDAVRTAVEHVRGRNKKDKKVLLVVTDGNDNSSVESLERLIRASQEADVVIYAVGLFGDETPRAAEKARAALDALARATGGQSYYPKEVDEIDRIGPQIAHEIRNQYILAYSPTDQAQDGTYRQIRVLLNVPDATVRTRSGYYALAEGAVRSAR